MKLEENIRIYLENFKSAKDNKWNYEDGCVLIGTISIYEVTREAYLKDFVLNYLDYYITEDGTIKYYDKEAFNIDCISTGRALFFAYEETGMEKYKKAIQILYSQIEDQPRLEMGNFWHKKIYPNQVWLDGLFMAMPFYMKYDTTFGNKGNYQDIIDQFTNVRTYLFCEEKQLYYHGFNESGIMPWADKENRCSRSFWLRSIGWLLLALIDTMEEMSDMLFEHFKKLEELFKEAIQGILKYQDKESGLFYQVVDRPELKDNYLETSGSAMISAAILKACRLGVLLNDKYQPIGEKILKAIIEQKLVEEEGVVKLKDICSMAGLGPGIERDGSVAYYLSEPIVDNDQKGTGALLMAYGQWLKLNEKNGIKVSL